MRGSDNIRPAALVLSPEAPYPLDGGGALRTASLLNYLARSHDVDLIAFRHPGQNTAEAIPPGLLRDTHTVQLREHGNSFVKKLLRNTGRLIRGRPPLVDRFSGYGEEIARLLGDRMYDVALLEHFWCASYAPLMRRVASRVAVDLHNIESSWHMSCARAEGFPRSAVHASFGRAALRLEHAWLHSCDVALTASENDAARIRLISPRTPVCVYRNALPLRNVSALTPDFALAFSANMEYEPNRTGVKWFVAEVWPRLRARFPDLLLRLIGKNEHAVAAAIQGAAGVECTGWVPDAGAHLAKAQVCIAPLLSGSGTRLKVLEAWAAARPVVATSIGAEGLDALDGESILLADTPELFARAVERLLIDKALRQKIAKAGRELYEQKYTWNAAWNALNGCCELLKQVESA